jgi:hypothetical protein
VYAVDRTCTEGGFSPLFLDNQGARDRAEAAARKALQVKLEKAVDPIACPKCEWYQADMVRVAGQRRTVWLVALAVFTAVAGVATAFVAFVVHRNSKEPWYSRELATTWHVAAIFLLVAAACLVVRQLIRNNWNPNSDTKWKNARRPIEAKNVMRKADYDRLSAQSGSAPRA